MDLKIKALNKMRRNCPHRDHKLSLLLLQSVLASCVEIDKSNAGFEDNEQFKQF